MLLVGNGLIFDEEEDAERLFCGIIAGDCGILRSTNLVNFVINSLIYRQRRDRFMASD